MATICVASLALVHSGILKNRRATTYNHSTSIRQDQLVAYGVSVCQERIVVDEHIITSANPDTALEVAFALLEMLTTKKPKKKVKNLMRC